MDPRCAQKMKYGNRLCMGSLWVGTMGTTGPSPTSRRALKLAEITGIHDERSKRTAARTHWRYPRTSDAVSGLISDTRRLEESDAQTTTRAAARERKISIEPRVTRADKAKGNVPSANARGSRDGTLSATAVLADSARGNGREMDQTARRRDSRNMESSARPVQPRRARSARRQRERRKRARGTHSPRASAPRARSAQCSEAARAMASESTSSEELAPRGNRWRRRGWRASDEAWERTEEGDRRVQSQSSRPRSERREVTIARGARTYARKISREEFMRVLRRACEEENDASTSHGHAAERATTTNVAPGTSHPLNYPENGSTNEHDVARRRAMDRLGLSYTTWFQSEEGPFALASVSPMDPLLNEIDAKFDPFALVNALSSWYSNGLAPLITVTMEVTRMSPPSRYVKRDQLGWNPPRMIFHVGLMARRDEFAAHALALIRRYHSDVLARDSAESDRPIDAVPTPDDSWIEHVRGFEWRCTARGTLPPRCHGARTAPLEREMREDHRFVDDTYHGFFSSDILGAQWLPAHDEFCNGRFEMVYWPTVDERRRMKSAYAEQLMLRRQNEASNELLSRRLHDLHKKSVQRELDWCRERNRVFYLDGNYLH